MNEEYSGTVESLMLEALSVFQNVSPWTTWVFILTCSLSLTCRVLCGGEKLATTARLAIKSQAHSSLMTCPSWVLVVTGTCSKPAFI